jgi:hypothetical protein
MAELVAIAVLLVQAAMADLLETPVVQVQAVIPATTEQEDQAALEAPGESQAIQGIPVHEA